MIVVVGLDYAALSSSSSLFFFSVKEFFVWVLKFVC